MLCNKSHTLKVLQERMNQLLAFMARRPDKAVQADLRKARRTKKKKIDAILDGMDAIRRSDFFLCLLKEYEKAESPFRQAVDAVAREEVLSILAAPGRPSDDDVELLVLTALLLDDSVTESLRETDLPGSPSPRRKKTVARTGTSHAAAASGEGCEIDSTPSGDADAHSGALRMQDLVQRPGPARTLEFRPEGGADLLDLCQNFDFMRCPVTMFADEVWEARGEVDVLTGKSRQAIEAAMKTVGGALHVDHTLEIALMDRLFVRAVLQVEGSPSGTLHDNLHAVDVARAGAAGFPHGDLWQAVVNDAPFAGDKASRGSANLNMVHHTLNQAKKFAILAFITVAFSGDPWERLEGGVAERAADASMVNWWTGYLNPDRTVHAFFSNIGLTGQQATRAIGKGLRSCCAAVEGRLCRHYERLQAEAAGAAAQEAAGRAQGVVDVMLTDLRTFVRLFLG